MHFEPAEPEGKGDMYWNIPLDVSTVNEIDQIKSYPDVTSDKQYHGSQFENDFPWLYYSHARHGWMCKICNAGPIAWNPLPHLSYK